MDRLRSLGGVLQVAAIVGAVTAYTRVSDKITAMNAQLRLASRSQADLNRLQQSSYQIAQRNGTAWEAAGTLLAKTVKAARQMGLEWNRAAELGENATRAISAGIRVSGTDAQAAAAGVFQLGQALASGVLRGDELNSVMENIPGVADALARAMGTTTGALRKMGSEGKLTSKAVIEGLEKARPELERLASLIPLTFGAAFQKVQNGFARLITSMDTEGVGVGGAIIKALDLLGTAMDKAAANAEVLSRILIGTLVAAAVRASVAAGVAGAAALAQARSNDAVAASAVRASLAQLAQARSSLQVAIAMNAQGAASRAQVAQAAAAVTSAGRAVGEARAAAAATGAAVGEAAARTSLLGRAFSSIAGLGRAAFAAVGGGVGIAIAALVALALWAGKAALSFQPIAGEAGTVSDYIAVAFGDAVDWVGRKFGELRTWVVKQMVEIGKSVRPVAVYIVDAFLSAARGAAAAVDGVVAAWKAGVGNIKSFLGGLSEAAGKARGGDFSGALSTAGAAFSRRGESVSAAFTRGASASRFKPGESGETIVRQIELLPGQIRNGISEAFKSSGLRDRANQRARDRANAANQGGDQGPGKPAVSPGTGDAGGKLKKGADERTFQDILDEAKEQAKLASLTTAEAEKQSAIYSAQKELKRELNQSEKDLLSAAVQQRQQNEANMRLQQQILDVNNQIFEARARSAAEDARAAGDYSLAAQIEAELQVQQALNQAKRDGIQLDQAKVEEYRKAVLLAARENEITKAQAEAKRALQEIADNARKAMQSAVSDGIYAALSGDIKGVGDFFKRLGEIARRQLAEELTYKLFQGGSKAQVEQARVTSQALEITAPAAEAVRQAGQGLAMAIQEAAASVAPTLAPLAPGEVAPLSASLVAAGEPIKTALLDVTDLINDSKGPLGGALGGIIRVLSSIFGIGGAGGNSGGVLASLLRGKQKDGAPSINIPGMPKTSGTLSKIGSGAMYGQLGGGIASAFGAKTSSLGSTLGGIAGSFIPGIGNVLGPLIGGALGGILGGLLGPKPKGSVALTNGSLTATGTGRDSDGLGGAGGSIQDQLQQMAKALGAKLGDYSIGLGQYKDYYQVSSNANDPRLGQTYFDKKSSSAVYDGKDLSAAIQAAIKVAISQGAFKGLSEGVSNALKTGVATVEEAADFVRSSKSIKLEALRLVDPVRAAVQEVDDEFSALRDQYVKFGESTVDLEKVYMDRRQKAIDQAMQDQLSGVKDFLAELKGGALGGRSLSEQVGYQDQLFKVIEQAQASGQKVNYDDLNSVGKALIDATRQLEGATPAFYEQVDRVMTALNKAIADGTNPNVTSLPAPLFQPKEVSEPIVNALNDNFSQLLSAMNSQSQAIVRGDSQTASEIRELRTASLNGRTAAGFDTELF